MKKMMNLATTEGLAGLLALASLGTVGCESEVGKYWDRFPVGGSSASVGLAPDGQCTEVYTHIVVSFSDHSRRASVSIHREGAGLGGTVRFAHETEAWRLNGWEPQAFFDTDGKPLDYVYASRMKLLDGSGTVKAIAFFYIRHIEGDPELQDVTELRVGPPDVADWEELATSDYMHVRLLPMEYDVDLISQGFNAECL